MNVTRDEIVKSSNVTWVKLRDVRDTTILVLGMEIVGDFPDGYGEIVVIARTLDGRLIVFPTTSLISGQNYDDDRPDYPTWAKLAWIPVKSRGYYKLQWATLMADEQPISDTDKTMCEKRTP